MLVPLALFVFFVWRPLVSNVLISFYETDAFFNKKEFVWFEKYKTVFSDPVFSVALANTFKYIFWSLVIGFLPPVIIGLLLNEVIHLKAFFRISIYFPSIISGIAVVLLWKYLYEPVIGINTLLGTDFLFLNDQNAVIPLIIITMTWRGAGGTVLIYLAALQTVDESLYEAARIDGANPLRRLYYISIPHIMPMLRMLFILQIISVFQVFYEPLVMTNGGGPNGASYSLMLLSYQYAFDVNADASLAAAVGVILSLIIISLTLMYLKISKPKED